ncbi:putative holin-like toxin [Virgibacillus profundi]
MKCGLACIFKREEVVLLTVFEALMVALTFGLLIVAMLLFDQKNKPLLSW